MRQIAGPVGGHIDLMKRMGIKALYRGQTLQNGTKTQYP